MKNLYILKGDKPVLVKTPEYVAYVQDFLKDRKIEAKDERILCALSILASGSNPWELGDGRIAHPEPQDKAFFEAVQFCYNASVKLFKQVEKGTETPKVEKEQAELNHALEVIADIKDAELEEQENKLREIVGKNFDILGCGGLALREDAPLTKEDGYTTIGAMIQQIGITKEVESMTNLGLGDVVKAVEDKFGEALDYTQLVETTGKSRGLITQARMVANHFPAKKRQVLDPHGKLHYSHFVSTVFKDLRPEDQDELIKFAVRRSSTSEPVSTTKLRKLAKNLAKVPVEDRLPTLQEIDEKITTTDGAIAVLRTCMQLSGAEVEARRRWMYIYTVESPISGVEVKMSNEYNQELAYTAHTVIKLVPMPVIMVGPDTFDEIEFVYTPPDIMEPDPQAPDEVFADYRIIEHEGQFQAVGTRDGKVEKLDLEEVSTKEEAVADLVEHFRLDENMTDSKGRKFRFRTD